MENRYGFMHGNTFVSVHPCGGEPTKEGWAEIRRFAEYLKLKGEDADAPATFKEWLGAAPTTGETDG